MLSIILCVDDEPINLSLLRNILQDDYKLVFARNGEEALAAALKHNPDLILLDVQMPDISGFEVAQQLKANLKTTSIPIVFVTSLFDDDHEKMGFDVGGIDYIIKPISPSVVRARVKTHLTLIHVSQLEASYRDAIYMLGVAGHYNDTNTDAHIWRMAAYAHLLAQSVGWNEERAKLLEMAAPLHDTGKIGIPDTILQKATELDAEEWETMKQHSQIGYDILNTSNVPLFQLAAEIALNHHERWDGSGYPNGLAGENIPESARIVAIADVFDTLSTRRPYKEPWPLERILVTLEELAGNHLEERLVTVFIKILPQILEIKAKWDSLSLLDGFKS